MSEDVCKPEVDDIPCPKCGGEGDYDCPRCDGWGEVCGECRQPLSACKCEDFDADDVCGACGSNECECECPDCGEFVTDCECGWDDEDEEPTQ